MKNKSKILHILYSGLGGTTDYVFNLIKADVNQKYEHHILFYGIEKVPLSQSNLATIVANSVTYIPKQKGYDKKAYKNVLEHIKIEKPNIITLHVNSLILTCTKYKKSKLIFVEHQANHLKTKKEWLWSVLAQLKANYIVCLSENYQSQLKNKLRFLFKKEINYIIKTGVVLTDYLIPKKENKKLIKIGMISRINNFRDHKTLINAFNKLKKTNIQLHIAGSGPLLKELKEKYASKNVIFHNHITQELIPLFLNELDIYCHATLGETSSVAVMQAQASKLPIIASNVNGINNILTTSNSLLVKPKNIDSYKNALELLITNENKRKELSAKSFAYAQANLSHFSMFKEYQKLFDQ
jgi:glycosyltransferase involved in cell wall biosynthesis